MWRMPHGTTRKRLPIMSQVIRTLARIRPSGLLAALLLCTALAACGGDGDNPPGNTNNPGTPSTPDGSTPGVKPQMKCAP